MTSYENILEDSPNMTPKAVCKAKFVLLMVKDKIKDVNKQPVAKPRVVSNSISQWMNAFDSAIR